MTTFVANVDVVGRIAVAYGFFELVVAAAIGTNAVVICGRGVASFYYGYDKDNSQQNEDQD